MKKQEESTRTVLMATATEFEAMQAHLDTVSMALSLLFKLFYNV